LLTLKKKMEEENLRLSEFNELQFKMIRIHKLQEQINDLWVNPLAANFAFGEYNYRLLISILQSLYSEVHPKCEEKEKEDIQIMMDEIEDYLEENEPYSSSNHPTSKKLQLDIDNWKELKKRIIKLNLKVRELLDAHGFVPDKNMLRGL